MKQNKLDLELEKLRSIEKTVGKETISPTNFIFLHSKAIEGMPRSEFDLSICLLLNFKAPELAIPWLNRFIKHANGWMLYRASIMLNDISKRLKNNLWMMYSLICLRRSAWRQYKPAKQALSKIKNLEPRYDA